MSYLDVPRIHFSGLFYSAPGNLNNDPANFDLSNALNYDTGLYKYPDGTSQLYLSNCVVTGVVGADGVLCSDSGRDSLVGARVTSPGPATQKPDGDGGLYGFAKMVDLDPSMQFRTEVYGFRIYVELEDGGGFSGELAGPPHLRDLWFGRGNAGDSGLQIAVGTWHQRLIGLTWTAPQRPSAVWEALRQNSSAGLDVKIGVDMFQTTRANEFTQGNRFGYGRLVAAIGPASAGDPQELVPGRRLYTPRTFDAQLTAAAPQLQSMTATAFTRQAAEEAMTGEESSVEWNRTDFRVTEDSSMLTLDLFNSAPLTQNPDARGQFDTGGAVVVGLLDGTTFTPLQNGAISFTYSKPDAATCKLADLFWPDHAAIFQIDLVGEEREKIRRTPLAIRAGTTTVLRENPNGVYVNVERPTIRLEPSQTEDTDVFSYAWGRPSALPAGLKLQTQLYTGQATTIFTAELDPVTVSPGRFRLRVATGSAITLPAQRLALDSMLCFVTATGTTYLVGEAMTLKPDTGPPTPPFLTLLFWQNHKVVVAPPPTWETNIQPIMRMYARMFPGMVSILDISDLATVKGFAGPLKDRFERLRTDPGFMPVSRDMSPATVDMVVQFLDGLMKEQS